MAKVRDFQWSPTELSALLGEEAAERTDQARLIDFFFETDSYFELASDAPIRVVVAHKGVGKTALLTAASKSLAPDHTIVHVTPESVVGIPVGVDGEFVQKKMDWKQGLRAVISEQLCRDFGLSDDDTIKHICGRARVTKQFLTLGVKSEIGAHAIDEKLSQYIKASIEDAIASGRVVVVLDDLDYGWAHSQGHEKDIERIATLFAAIMEMATEQPGLLFRIAIRSEIHYLVRTAYVDVDRLRGSYTHYRWMTPKEILAAFVKRILTYQRDRLEASDRPEFHFSDQQLLAISSSQLATHFLLITEHKARTGILWSDCSIAQILLTMVRQRPRDLILLVELIAKHVQTRMRQATDQRSRIARITGADLLQALPDYSKYLLDELTTEHRAQFPALRSFVEQMTSRGDHLLKNRGYVYTTDELIEQIWTVCKLPLFQQKDHQFAPALLDQYKKFEPREIIHFLFKVNFLVARQPSQANRDEVVRIYFDVSRFNELSSTIDDSVVWEIHPAFWWAVTPASTLTKTKLHDFIAPVDVDAVST